MNRLVYILLMISALSCGTGAEPQKVEEIVKLSKLTVKHKDYNTEDSYEFEYDSMGRLHIINRFSKGKLYFIETYFYQGMDKYPFKKEQTYVDRFIETTSDGTPVVVEKLKPLSLFYYIYDSSLMTITERYNDIITNVYKYNGEGNIISRTYTYGKSHYTYNDANNVKYSSKNDLSTLEYIYDNYKNPFKDIFFFTVLGELIEYPVGFGENNIIQVNLKNSYLYIIDNQYNKEGYPALSKIYLGKNYLYYELIYEYSSFKKPLRVISNK